jgi:hypothetical protein
MKKNKNKNAPNTNNLRTMSFRKRGKTAVKGILQI